MTAEPAGQNLASIGYLLIVLMTYLAVRVFDWVKGAVRQSRDVASQTQTTYTELRGAARARFQVLAEHSHG